MGNFRRRLMMQKSGIVLPEGYTRLEYASNAKASWAQYRDRLVTNYTFLKDDSLDIVVRRRDSSPFMGGYMFKPDWYSETADYWYLFGTRYSNITYLKDTWLHYKYENHILTEDVSGLKLSARTSEEYSSYKFAIFGSSASPYHANCDIASVKISNADGPVMDLIPALRQSDNIVGMFDLISNSFFESEDGILVAGPEV